MADIARRAYDFYLSQGLAPHQAAAMVGHMMAESGGNPTIQETRKDGTKGPGYGAFQWTSPDRRAGLETFANSKPVKLDPNALETQLLYSLYELDNSESAAGKKLYGAKTYQEAVDAGMDYLRPEGYKPGSPTSGHNYSGRFNFGAQLAGVQPLMGTAIASAGDSGAPPPSPTAGLLVPSTQIDTSAASAAAEKARLDKEQEAAFAGVTKTGMGLLQQAQPEPVKFMQGQINVQAPKPNPPPLPNYRQQAQGGDDEFMRMLMQQRLQRRV